MTTKIPSGRRAYTVGSPPVDAEGVTFSGADLDVALTQRLPPILSDSAGTRRTQDLPGGVANTAFSADNLRAALKPARTVYDWQVGEAFAEAYLADHRQCEFPWPSGRDLRNPERIRAAMLDHGLDAHQLDQRDGYFKVILPGPNGDYARLRVPADARGFVPPSVEAQLNDRQKRIMVEVQAHGVVTSGWCLKTLGITYNTAYLDLSGLVRKGLLVREGKGRATRYRLAAVRK